ncbi:MAG: type II secretion system F family protein [Butyrivibrio sp.]|nr:type II secretion system F family protein [Butyrivibrio sp.]
MAEIGNVKSKNEDGAVSRLLYKLSLEIYRLFIRKRHLPGSEKVRNNLSALYSSKNLEKLEAEYYTGKISVVIIMLFSGVFLSLMLHLSAVSDSGISDDGTIMRSGPGEGDQKIELLAKDDEGTILGEYDFEICEQLYTPEEADRLFESASDKVEAMILGKNPSLDQISEDLNLVKELDGYPFAISWQTDNYEIISSDGSVSSEEIPKEGILVELQGTYKYQDKRWQQVIYVKVVPRKLSNEEKMERAIHELLKASEEDSRYEDRVMLPSEYENGHILWSEKRQDNSLILLLLMIIAGGALFVMKDKELQKNMEDRRQQLLSEYPQLVSQLVLFMGAGMTVRNVFARLSEEYLAKREQGMSKSYMYEELVRTNREIQAGKSEAKAYEAFGIRCQGQEYSRLCTLLTQNLRKGNGELLNLLQEESRKAFEDRMGKVRKKGEEAGTKLLFPMVMMLLIVMVVIMIPAYMTF